MTTQTLAQRFAREYAAGMVESMLTTIKRVRQAATVIMVIAMAVSFNHQREFLVAIGAPVEGSILIPISLDMLTFICVKVLGTSGMAGSAKRAAITIMAFPVIASGAVNFLAPGAFVTKSLYVVAVLTIPAAEWLASLIRPDFSIIAELESLTAESAGTVEPEVAPHPLAGRTLTEEQKQARREARERNARDRERQERQQRRTRQLSPQTA